MSKKEARGKSFTVAYQWRILRRLLHHARPFKRQFMIALTFALILSVINVALPRLLQFYMDHQLTRASTGLRALIAFAVLYFTVTVFQAAVQFVESFSFSMGAERTLESLRVLLFKKLHTLGLRYYDQTPAGSIVSRVTNDTKTLYDFWTLFLYIVVALFAMISAFAAMWTVSWLLALLTLLFIPVLLALSWLYQHLSSRIYRRLRSDLGKINTKLNESLLGIDIIQQFGQQKRITNEFEQVNGHYLRMRNHMINVNALLLSSVINLLFTLAEVVALTGFGLRSFAGFTAVGVVYAFLSYQQNFFNPLSDVMNYLSYFQDGIAAGSRIIQLLDNNELAPQQKTDNKAKVTAGEVKFDHVSFGYDPSHPVLKDITFTAKPGQTVALVGHTGSGKSSIINVLLRFYEYQAGRITVDGHDLRSFAKEELRRQFGLVLQEPFLFYGNVMENIRMGDQTISDDQVKRAAKFVDADQFIAKLPGKYHAKVNEQGKDFSAGQRQLLAFARTIVRQPKILILDEATANIDPQTEQLITRGLKKMRRQRTTIAIAHRLSTIQDADLILVLDHGRIVERGTHEELLKKGGRYAQLYALQQDSQ